MSYTNPNSAAAYTQTAVLSGATIADDQYVVDPYAKTLTLNATGSSIVVVSGGKVSLGQDKWMSNATVGAGGSIACGVRPYFYNLTVESGGKVTLGTGAHFSGFTTFGKGGITNYTAAYTVDGVIHDLIIGAQNLHLNKGANAVDVIVRGFQFWVSGGVTAENVIASGGSVIVAESGTVKTLTVSSGAKLDLKAGGTVSGLNILAGANISAAGAVYGLSVADGATLNLLTNAGFGGTVSFNSGAIVGDADAYAAGNAVYNLTVSADKEIRALSGAIFRDATVNSGGKLSIMSAGVVSGATVLAGGLLSATGIGSMTDTVVEEGGHVTLGHGFHICGNGNSFNAGAITDSPDAYTVDGVIHDLTVDAKNIHLQNGADAEDVTILRNELYVSAATTVTGVDIKNGALYVRGGTVRDIVASKGTIYVSAGLASGAVISSGARLTASLAGAAFADITVEDGGKWSWVNGIHISGKYSFGSGAITNATSAYTDENGAIHALNFANIVHLHDGATLIDAKAGGNIRISAGGLVDGVTQAGGGVTLQGGTLLNADITKSGGLVISTTYLNRFGGAETNIVATGVTYYGGGNDADLYAENGVLHNLKLVASGNWLKRLLLVDGITAAAPVISSGGTLFIASGARLDGAEVLQKGSLCIEADTTAAGDIVISSGGSLIMSPGAVAAGDVTVAGGGWFYGGTFADGATVDLADFSVVGGSNFNIGAGGIKLGGEVVGGAYAENGVIRNIDVVGHKMQLVAGAGISGVRIGAGGLAYIYTGCTASNVIVDGVYTSGGAIVPAYGTGVTLSGGSLYMDGGSADGVTVQSGGFLSAANCKITNFTFYAKSLYQPGRVVIGSGAYVSGAYINGRTGSATIEVAKGGWIDDVNFNSGNTVIAGTITDLQMRSGGLLNIAPTGYGSKIMLTQGQLYVSAGLAEDVTVGGGIFHVSRGTARDVRQTGGTVNMSGTAAKVYDATVTGGTFNAKAGVVSGAVLRGGTVNVSSGAAVSDLVISGGTLNLSAGAVTDSVLHIDFAGKAGYTGTLVNDLSLFTGTGLNVANVTVGKSYNIAGVAGTAAATFSFAGGSLYDGMNLAVGESFTNGVQGYTYSFDGMKLTAADAGIATAATAGKLAGSATTINGSDLAAKWTANTAYSTNVFLAADMTAGDAWLDIDGFANANANLYGAAKDQNFAGTVNIGATNGTIKNLAAGAGLGGTVAGVKLTVGENMNVKGAVYAGGMGNVTGATETQIDGGAFNGNVFAGALCNYVANGTTTEAGDIALTVDGGVFTGNIYAGAAVKAGAATGIVHTAGDITVELNAGAAAKNTFCVYGGGYATGTTANKVYTAEDVIIGVTGGSWGTYLSGRGIFGGVYADTVAASVDSVAISVSGGTMGNIYGGGWAQNGGSSTVGDVTITVTGDAEVANVFAGGSYSSNGETEVGNVTILISGGDVRNNIFAGGQGEFSTVGNVNVTFTGSNGYDCNVYGYGVPQSATDPATKTLFFTGYTGTITGAIGGFDAIAFEGDTMATLSGTTIDNGEWSFDYTDRTLDAGLAMLTLDSGTFAGDNVAVDLSAAAQAAAGWSIATGLTAANATFDVELSTGSAANLALGDALGDAYGVYAGWGFTLEDSTLKFKQLA